MFELLEITVGCHGSVVVDKLGRVHSIHKVMPPPRPQSQLPFAKNVLVIKPIIFRAVIPRAADFLFVHVGVAGTCAAVDVTPRVRHNRVWNVSFGHFSMSKTIRVGLYPRAHARYSYQDYVGSWYATLCFQRIALETL